MEFMRMFARSVMGLAVLAGVSAAGVAEAQFMPGTLAADRSGLWVAGQTIDNADYLIKYDNALNPVFARPYGVTQGFSDSYFAELVPLRDGGLIVIGENLSAFGELPPGYSFHRVDSAGNPVWSLQGLNDVYYPNDNFSTFGDFFFGADMVGAIWFPVNGKLERVDANGVLTDVATIGTSVDGVYAAAVDPTSGALYIVPQTDTNILDPQTIVRFDPNGTSTTIWTAPNASTLIQFLSVGSDGNVYALGNNSTAHIAFSLSSTGSARWSTTFGSSLYAFSQHSTTAATQVASYEGGGFVALDASSALSAISAGGQVKQLPLPASYQPSPFQDTLIQTTTAGDILLYAEEENEFRLDQNGNVLQTLSTSNYGVPVVLADGSEVLGGPPTPGGPVYLHIDRSGNTLGTLSFAISTSPPSPIRVDQIGIDGAWYVKAESGQGFVIDYLPTANAIFMPWFTYGLAPVSDTSGLQWISFQGTPVAGATSVDLVMGSADGGTFNAGIVTPHAVGTGKLTFTDCSTGRLQYKFNDDTFGGQGGYMPLTRTLPSTTPCILANGTTSPAQNASAPANGFDARQSGSWYSASTSGQGIEFTVVPAGNGFGGFLFGAWFTFDAPPANDAKHQHWFTLQTGLSNASNGSVTTSILQNVGGSLDSLRSDSIVSVGTATVTMLACDKATVAYTFDHSTAAGAFAGLTGTLNLTKGGGCAP